MNFKEYLDTHETLTFNTKGISMLPMIKQDRDLVILRKKQPDERLKKYDVAMYHARDGRYLLHRIIKLEECGYTFLGDNLPNKERHIREEQVCAVLIGFVHKGKQYSTDDTGYKVYYHVHYALYPIRFMYIKLRGFAVKFKHKLTGS